MISVAGLFSFELCQRNLVIQENSPMGTGLNHSHYQPLMGSEENDMNTDNYNQ